ncbi:MAG: fibrobacter succinogenes major paralogous domain-containing protein, partial [Bacteroidales bacterium]|nr:fibrobacter succinogenes major paralogous domain-containing protein [Bacteroidales bacterium]
TEVWLPGKQGTAPNKFNAYGAGYYDGSIHRYLNLLAETHFWAADNANGSATAKNFVLNYYCSEGLVEDGLKGLGYSIRCIQKK